MKENRSHIVCRWTTLWKNKAIKDQSIKWRGYWHLHCVGEEAKWHHHASTLTLAPTWVADLSAAGILFWLSCCLRVQGTSLFVISLSHLTSRLSPSFPSLFKCNYLSTHCFCYCIWLSVEFEVCRVCITVFLVTLACCSVDAVTHLTAACRVMV